MDGFGILSLLPPVLAIVLAMMTKQVLLSLFLGIWFGATMLAGWNPIIGLVNSFGDFIIPSMSDSWNASVLLMTMFVGAFSAMLERGGGAHAFGQILRDKIKTRKQGQIITALGGVGIFFSDSTNPVVVGPIFRPITDFLKISREKLAYIVDSTSASMPLLFPFTAWGAYVMGIIANQFQQIGYQDNPLVVFTKSIPFQYYTIAVVAMTFIIGLTGIDYGPMKKAEERALVQGKVIRDGAKPLRGEIEISIPKEAKPTIWNMVAPLIVLVILIFGMFLWTGGFPQRGILEALGNADSMKSLVVSFFIASMVAAYFAVKSGVFDFVKAVDTWIEGIRQMMDALLILILAWAIGSVCGKVGTSTYIVNVTKNFLTPTMMYLSIFLAACITSFSTGTSWGTFAIFLPISIPLAIAIDAPLYPAIATVLSGGLFGDHCSPISDTTILSSMGSTCDHIDHVKTQLPYAITVAVSAGIGYLIAGITKSAASGLIITFILLLGLVFILGKFGKEKRDSQIEMIGK
jgi:Na+/H+ antiporter NhaC